MLSSENLFSPKVTTIMLLEQEILSGNDYFTVTSCLTHKIPGYYIIAAKNHVFSIAEMSDQQVQELGLVIKRTQEKIREQVRPEKIYCLTFCEVLAIFHMHLFPRTKLLLEEFRQEYRLREIEEVNGPLLFNWARNKCKLQGE